MNKYPLSFNNQLIVQINLFAFSFLLCLGSLSAQKINFVGIGELDLQKMTKFLDRDVPTHEGCTTSFKGFQNETIVLYTYETRCAGIDDYNIKYILYNRGEVAQIIEKVAYIDEDNDPFYNEIGYFYYWQYLDVRSGKIKSLDANIEEAGLQNTRCAGKEAPYCKEQLEIKKIESETLINMISNSQLALGQQMKTTDKLWSQNGEYYCNVNPLGRLSVKKKDGSHVWDTPPRAKNMGEGVILKFQPDGNLCVYDDANVFTWGAGCGSENPWTRGISLHMDDDGIIRIKNMQKKIVWSSTKS